MVVRIEHRVKCQLRQLRRDTKDKGMYRRCQIVLLAARDRPRQQIAESVGCSVSWVWRVVKRFVKDGVAGLVDHREDNGALKLDEHFLAELHDAVDRCPRDYGYPRPTWTQELLCRVMAEKTGVRVHPGTMSRGLAILRARLGWPKPTVNCPWPKHRRNRRLLEIRRRIDSLGRDEMAFYLDEVDIHLNPKIGRDWMNRGQQKVVVTPGQNVKRYLAGAQDAVTGELIWVRGERKNSLLVIALLRELVRRHPTTKRIHVVLDNFKIHDSRATRAAVKELSMRAAHGLQRAIGLEELAHLQRQIRTIEKHLAEIARDHAGIKLLMSIPGVGIRTAEAFCAYVDDISRFGSSRQVTSYFGLVPCQDSSADRNHLGHITRDGPGTVRKLLCEASWQAIRLSPTLRTFYERVRHEDPQRNRIALVATSRRLCQIMAAMLRSGEVWRESVQWNDSGPSTSVQDPRPREVPESIEELERT